MRSTPQDILKAIWGYDQFRPLQPDIINSVLSGNDTLALMPTGGGKSICYQVPALAMDGLCLVVSPLIALMKDQLEGLKAKGIRALAIWSGMSYREVDAALDNAALGGYKFLFVSPERLQSDLFQAKAPALPVSLLAVDEAHCISQWGYDFRPSYLQIAEVRSYWPDVPVLALTASATPKVQADIQEKLHFRKGSQVFRMSFDRPNLVYAVLGDEDKRGRIKSLLEKVKGTAIIYVNTRRATRMLADWLRSEGYSADYYHGGLDSESRSRKQNDWKAGRTRIVVCTNAFGMGIDKPDVRLVIHYELPYSLEAYYQEAGRGGRDGRRSFAIALAHESDKAEMEGYAEKSFPEIAEVKAVYHALGNFLQMPMGSGAGESFDFDIKEFAKRYDFKPLKVYQSLKVLEEAGKISLSESVFLPSRFKFTTDTLGLYTFEVANRAYEPLLKTLLRSYGGCFEDYVEMNERDVAVRMKTTVKEVVQSLHFLQKQELLDYVPQTMAPQLTWLTDRLPDTMLGIDHRLLRERKEATETRIKAMLAYAYSHDRCRGNVLLHYFGEETTQDCGHCDWCLKEKDKDEEGDMEKLMAKVKSILADGPQHYDHLMKTLNHGDTTFILTTLRRMMDDGKLRWREGKVLEWVG